MSSVKTWVREQWITMLVFVFLGFWIAPMGQTWWHSVLSAYDDARPIVKMSGRVVRADADSVWVAVSGEKLRDCAYVRVQAFTVDQKGVMRDAYARREDMPERGDTKPIGKFSIGVWRIWPREDAAAVQMYAVHNCHGRLVQTLIAEVAL